MSRLSAETRARMSRNAFERVNKSTLTDPTASELKLARVRAKLSQAQLAEMVGMHVSSYQDLERGYRRGSRLAWTAIAHALGVERSAIIPADGLARRSAQSAAAKPNPAGEGRPKFTLTAEERAHVQRLTGGKNS